MKTSYLLEKLWLDKKEFVTAAELKNYCELFGIDYENLVRYLMARGYLLRIFRGIFYLRSSEERRLNSTKYSFPELLARGMELKGVSHWYFGLYTALKFNNITHEHFTVDYVLSDVIFRSQPVEILGRKVRFVKIRASLFGFGILKENGISYSDVEKTVLDFIYLWRYRGHSEERIVLDISEYMSHASPEKLSAYVKHYSRSVAGIIEKAEGIS